jgi:hypothetical protein
MGLRVVLSTRNAVAPARMPSHAADVLGNDVTFITMSASMPAQNSQPCKSFLTWWIPDHGGAVSHCPECYSSLQGVDNRALGLTAVQSLELTGIHCNLITEDNFGLMTGAH